MDRNDRGIFDSTAATFVWKDCENLEKFSRLIQGGAKIPSHNALLSVGHCGREGRP